MPTETQSPPVTPPVTLPVEVAAEITDDGSRVEVTFPYHQLAVRAIKRVPGARFVPPNNGGPLWRMPRDLTTMRLLREHCGDSLVLGPKLIKWGKKAVAQEKVLTELQGATDATLSNLRAINPEFADYLRDYQRAGVAMMAAQNIINADHPGLGKTVQTIAAIMEQGEEHYHGPHLIIAPKTSLEVVWQKELEKWTDLPVIQMSGDDSPAVRRELLDLVLEFEQDEDPFFLVMNPAFVRYEVDKEKEKIPVRGKLMPQLKPSYPELFAIEWNTIVFDEYHKMGLSNNKTNMFAAANDLRAHRKFLLSGTPMGGKPIKLWGALHFLHPESFTSKWRWADQWLDVEDNGYGKVIQGIQSGREQQFWEHLKPYMVRRTKAEVMKELPPKQYINVWCDMTPKQKKQYDSFAADAEIKIEEESLSATGILAEYMRLKQFAGAHQKVKKFGNGEWKLEATTESGKLAHIMQILDERGIRPTKGADEEQEGNQQVVIASQFKNIVDMVTKYLNEQGINAEKITGDVSNARRTDLVQRFQSGEVRVMCLTTTAGGVSITLDNADTAILLDETWDPDDQEQLEDRIHRMSRIHQVTIYYLRSKDSIEQYIKNLVEGKAITNREILDLRRQGLRAV